MGHCKLAGPTVWRSAGLLAACLAAVFLLRLPVLSASGSSGLSESGGSGSGAEEDAPGSADFRTPVGSYALTGEVVDQRVFCSQPPQRRLPYGRRIGT